MRRALSSAIRFSSMFAWAESLSSIFSLVRSILPWGRVKEPLASGAGGDRATGCKGLGVAGQWEVPDQHQCYQRGVVCWA